MGDPIPLDMEVNGCQFLLPSDLKLDGSSELLDRNVGQIDIYLVYKAFSFNTFETILLPMKLRVGAFTLVTSSVIITHNIN